MLQYNFPSLTSFRILKLRNVVVPHRVRRIEVVDQSVDIPSLELSDAVELVSVDHDPELLLIAIVERLVRLAMVAAINPMELTYNLHVFICYGALSNLYFQNITQLPCFGKPESEEKLRCGKYTPEILTENTDNKRTDGK